MIFLVIFFAVIALAFMLYAIEKRERIASLERELDASSLELESLVRTNSVQKGILLSEIFKLREELKKVTKSDNKQ